MPVPVIVETLDITDSTAAIAAIKTSMVAGNQLVGDPFSMVPLENCSTPNCMEGIIKLVVPGVEHVSNWLDQVMVPVGQNQGQENSESETTSGVLSMSAFKGHGSVPTTTLNPCSGTRNEFVFFTFRDSLVGNSMRRHFVFAFSIFQMHGVIDLDRRILIHGTFAVMVPAFGPLRLATSLGDCVNLEDSNIQVKLPSTTNMNGGFTLSLDSKCENLLIDYEIYTRFAGTFQDSGVIVVPFQASHATSSTTLSYSRLLNLSKPVVRDPAVLDISFANVTNLADLSFDHSLFDDFIENFFDEEHGHIVVAQQRAAQGYNFCISFLDIFELQGHLNLNTLRIVATLFLVVPIWGRIDATAVSGSLEDCVTARIALTRNNLGIPQDDDLARGSITLFLQNRVLTAKVNASVRFAGQINETCSLVTLPLPF